MSDAPSVNKRYIGVVTEVDITEKILKQFEKRGMIVWISITELSMLVFFQNNILKTMQVTTQ